MYNPEVGNPEIPLFWEFSFSVECFLCSSNKKRKKGNCFSVSRITNSEHFALPNISYQIQAQIQMFGVIFAKYFISYPSSDLNVIRYEENLGAYQWISSELEKIRESCWNFFGNLSEKVSISHEMRKKHNVKGGKSSWRILSCCKRRCILQSDQKLHSKFIADSDLAEYCTTACLSQTWSLTFSLFHHCKHRPYKPYIFSFFPLHFQAHIWAQMYPLKNHRSHVPWRCWRYFYHN